MPVSKKPDARPPTEVQLPWPLHDPMQRALVFDSGCWQFRAFAWNDPKHRYFAPRGMLHLQLWHPARRLSILTPSRLTEGAWEACIDGERLRYGCYPGGARYLCDTYSVRVPPPDSVEFLETWFVRAALIGAVPRPSQEPAPA